MLTLPVDAERAVAVAETIRGGDVPALRRLLDEEPDLASARIVDASGVARTLLHVVADWPGHFPSGAETVAVLIAAGADPDAPVLHPRDEAHAETPLHWAASSNDVEVLDALLDGGADIEAPGAVFTGGTAMSDAVIFGQWNAAGRLLERGATTTLWQAAALGLVDRVETHLEASPRPPAEAITNAFWHACGAGQRSTAELLLECGADPRWVGHDGKTPLDVAREAGASEIVAWQQSLEVAGDDEAPAE